jgi:hypothetical protein
MAKKHMKKCGPAKRPPKNRSRLALKHLDDQIRVDHIFEKIDFQDFKAKMAVKKIEDGYKKGRLNEERFEKIFEGEFEKPSWFMGVRRANGFEDRSQGTDFFVLTSNYGEIRFDVKSSFEHFDRQREAQKDMPIFVWGIVIKDRFSDEVIRQRVFTKCEIHIARMKRRVRLGIFDPRTV